MEKEARVYCFHKFVAMALPGSTRTAYVTVEEAREIRAAMGRIIRGIERGEWPASETVEIAPNDRDYTLKD